MYTVVVCSNCRHTWIVKDRPKTSQCRKCRKTRKFEKLKKYLKSDDIKEARNIRAQMQAKINDDEDHFKRALEKGHLHEDVNEVIEQKEYLDGLGMDSSLVFEKADELLESQTVRKSHRKVIDEWVADPDDTTIDDFLRHTSDHGIENGKALSALLNLARSAQIELPGNHELSDVSDAHSEYESSEWEAKEIEETDDERSRFKSKKLEAVIGIVHDDKVDTVDEVLKRASKKGISRDLTVDFLEKLHQHGEIAKFSSEDTQQVKDCSKDESPSGPPSGSHGDREDPEAVDQNDSGENSTQRSSSYREIMESSFEELQNPTEDDILKYAVE